MTWRHGGRKRPAGRDWQPILSYYEEPEEGPNPLEQLTHKQRFVLELRCGWVDGIEYPQREIAGLMGVSRSMVNQHEQAAKKKLQKYLRKSPAPQTPIREESK